MSEIIYWAVFIYFSFRIYWLWIYSYCLCTCADILLWTSIWQYKYYGVYCNLFSNWIIVSYGMQRPWYCYQADIAWRQSANKSSSMGIDICSVSLCLDADELFEQGSWHIQHIIGYTYILCHVYNINNHCFSHFVPGVGSNGPKGHNRCNLWIPDNCVWSVSITCIQGCPLHFKRHSEVKLPSKRHS